MKNMHPYNMQEAVRSYIANNLATHAGGIAAHIPVVAGFDYQSIEPPVIAVVCGRITNKQPTQLFDGTRNCEIGIHYFDMQEVLTVNRFSNYSALTDLVYDTNFLAYLNARLIALGANILCQYFTIEEETFATEGSIHQMSMALTVMTYTTQ